MIQLICAFPRPLDRLYEWRPGDHITHLDGRSVEDILDLYYYQPESERTVLGIGRLEGDAVDVEMDPADIDAVTGCFAPMEFRTCACNCVFCFVDQNPAGMRDQIYVKDEDYRFSFLYGNYITLTSLGRKGMARIIEQRMTPLFVSVHATDIDVRTRMLGIKRRIDVIPLLRELCDAGIEVHTQVVLCPGWNDGATLEKTFRDLLELAPAPADDEGGVRSLAIVPVGLSAHRDELTRLDPVTPEKAAETIDRMQEWQQEALDRIGERFAYLSDEFYLLADRPFPPTDHYDEFWQIDNAIGLTPRLRETWAADLADLADPAAAGERPTRPLTILTGELAAKAWRREFLPMLAAGGAPSVEVIGVENTLYGNSVTVAGLLGGKDLRRALLALPPEPVRTVALSPRVLNADGLTLDDLTLDQLAAGQPHEVVVAEEEALVDFWIDLR